MTQVRSTGYLMRMGARVDATHCSQAKKRTQRDGPSQGCRRKVKRKSNTVVNCMKIFHLAKHMARCQLTGSSTHSET